MSPGWPGNASGEVSGERVVWTSPAQTAGHPRDPDPVKQKMMDGCLVQYLNPFNRLTVPSKQGWTREKISAMKFNVYL